MLRTRRSNKRKAALSGSKGQPTNNFLASGRKMNWFMVGASIFASNLGSEHFIGLSGSAAATGLSVAAFEMNALVILQLATWIFMPVLIVSKISTLPEYMSKRFGGKRIRTYLAVLSILLYIFTKISVNLYSGGIFIQQAIGWNLYTSAMFILALTCIMTLTGGLKGAMVIDNLQAVVMTLGASIVSTKALMAIGGWQGLKHRYALATPSKVPQNLTRCAGPNPRAFQMLRPLDDRNMPWLGFLLGQTPASVWYWAADQMMVQRFLSARSLAHAQGSSIFAGYLKILPLLFMVIPGMISRCLYTDEVGCIDPEECQRYCQSSVSCSNTAYPRLVLELMPMGARGMMVAAMVAALMGDLCNVFNSASALFCCDIYPLFRKHSTTKEQETAGRVFVVCLVFASIMWIPAIQEMQGGQLFIYIQAVAAMFAPPIAAVYCCAVLWSRTNETGAFWSMMLGFALGIYRMVLSFLYKEPSCGQEELDERPWILKDVHYMYYAALLFWATVIACLAGSWLTKPPANFRLIRTTYWTRFDTTLRKDDRNVFEMKYSGPRKSAAPATEKPAAGEDPQRKLFTIEEQQQQQVAAADLSSVIVDINKAAGATPSFAKRPALQHQSSLSAAAVGAASEAGKFLANKLATTEVNLKGARDMVKAAASHLTKGGGGGPQSRIKFKNLNGEEEDDEEDDDDQDDDDDDEDDDDDDQTTTGGQEQESTMDEDGDESRDQLTPEVGANRKRGASQRTKERPKRQKSVLSALSSYKIKQKQGYQTASNLDDDDEDGDEDDDDLDEKSNLNRSCSYKDPRGAASRGIGRRSASVSHDGATGAAGRARRSRRRSKKAAKMARRLASYEEDEESAVGSSSANGRNYKCLDNSVSLLMKSPMEELMLRVALVAICMVCLGMFVLFSLPPQAPPSDLVDMLKQEP